MTIWLNSATIISAENPSHLTLTLLSSQNGATIEKKAECKTCTCQDAGEMVCEDFECPALNCDDNEIEGKLDLSSLCRKILWTRIFLKASFRRYFTP